MKRKIEFLQAKLNECNLADNSELNPYPLLFVSRKVYDSLNVSAIALLVIEKHCAGEK